MARTFIYELDDPADSGEFYDSVYDGIWAVYTYRKRGGSL